MKRREMSIVRSGFTLIEISVVLVIIGLIVGGILVGRHLVDSATMKAQIVQISKLNTALNTFRGKYDMMPGDLTQADVAKLGFTDYFVYGDGNGIVNDTLGVYDTSSWYIEPVLFFSQLADAGLTEKYTYHYPNPTGFLSPIRTLPVLKLNENSGMIAATYKGKVWYFLGVANTAMATAYLSSFCSPALTPSLARELDTKMDDGIPGTGIVLASTPPVTALSGHTTDLDLTPSQCVTDATATAYNTSSTRLWCSMLISSQ